MGGYMISQQRRIDDPVDSNSPTRGGGGGPRGLLLGTILGVGIGLLAAPQPGTKTRKLLLKRLAALGEGVEEGLDDVQERSGKARKRVKQRLAKLREGAGEEWEDVGDRWEHAKRRLRDFDFDERDESSPLGTILAVAAGAVATYLLTSDRAEPVRTRVQHAATDVKRRATDQWDRFQRGGFRAGRGGESQEGRSETRAGSSPSDEAPQAS
jgi:gas vesicle protein